MKLSFSIKGWERYAWTDYVRTAKEMELQGIELRNIHGTSLTARGGPFHAHMAAATLRELYEAGLSLPCIDAVCDIADGDKLEEYFSQRNIAAILYSNPNNPAWICLTDEELQIIGECATKYDVIVLEDMAYLCMDFRRDLSKPFQPPYQATVAKYTDNYAIMLSASKIFSYAGERIAIVCISDKLYKREYPSLRNRFNLGSFGDNFIMTYLYCASSGTSHSAQYALSAMFKAAVDGEYNFVGQVKEYAVRSKRSREILEKHGFHLVYDKDIDQTISDGFFYTAGYKDLDNKELLERLMRCGITAIGLNSTGSNQRGIRVCVSRLLSDDDFEKLDQRLALFENL